MLKALQSRLFQKHRTIKFPSDNAKVPDRFRGLPSCDFAGCRPACSSCVSACPTGALCRERGPLLMDIGKCIFCGDCEHACPEKKITFTKEYSIAARSRHDLVLGDRNKKPEVLAVDKRLQKLLGRSLKLRQVSAGGCNACEADTNVLSTIGFDLGRFGIQFVASPRHADGILVTGPVTKNMKLALEKTWAAIPSPKIAIALGACAISGGIYEGHQETGNGAESIIPIDLFIPGCPPHPLTILDALLRLLGKL